MISEETMRAAEVQIRAMRQAMNKPRLDLAASLNLVDGLLAEESDRQFRCAICRKMRRPGEVLVMVPDGVLPGDPAWSITARCGELNGTSSGWCLSCAPKTAVPKRVGFGFWRQVKKILKG
jgi:hypothetical protein